MYRQQNINDASIEPEFVAGSHKSSTHSKPYLVCLQSFCRNFQLFHQANFDAKKDPSRLLMLKHTARGHLTYMV